MSSTTSSETRLHPLLEKVAKAGISRWKLEALTGLLGIQSLQRHQAETEKNVQAENQRVRKELWGYTEPEAGEDMANQTILGDVTHPTPIVMAGQQQSSVLPALAALAIGMLIPGAGVAGYVASKLLAPSLSPVDAPIGKPTTDESLDVGLGRFSDLIQEAQSTK